MRLIQPLVKTRIRRLITISVAAVALLFAAYWGVWLYGYGPPAKQKDERSFIDVRIKLVRPGMKESSVRSLLGDPESVDVLSSVPVVTRRLEYYGLIHLYYVHFGGNQRVTHIEKTTDL